LLLLRVHVALSELLPLFPLLLVRGVNDPVAVRDADALLLPLPVPSPVGVPLALGDGEPECVALTEGVPLPVRALLADRVGDARAPVPEAVGVRVPDWDGDRAGVGLLVRLCDGALDVLLDGDGVPESDALAVGGGVAVADALSVGVGVALGVALPLRDDVAAGVPVGVALRVEVALRVTVGVDVDVLVRVAVGVVLGVGDGVGSTPHRSVNAPSVGAVGTSNPCSRRA
jgi:hypothetical protein